MKDFTHLMTDVFSGRMGGERLAEGHVSALARFIDAMPAIKAPKPEDETAVSRGKTLFNDAKVACATCHAGSMFTNNLSFTVGTGRLLQVPGLKGLAVRAPFMHTGCAPTLKDRFTNRECGGGDKHGVTSHLSAKQIDDLVAYLETL